ncbi:MAG TPA: sugar ABC transporter ATP-binding protein [Geminicoccus sp.]|uniref:sugar ABC transporter ATP-binding protein n=1 Tax=Geminicoccus sp. TaxID=2024832 RepID=UPI002BA75E18|nr:sugar ABC transporter ATP-binding protein [Geminicoccus sp.]HWL69131.1 sugar ABC transporter ATP-binding protein [Geminicoccus sp.]
MSSTAPVLAAEGLVKRFFGNPVLKDVSIEIVPGRVHALLGENGAGKSTLVNLLSGVLSPDEGRLRVDGQPCARLTPALARRHGIAVVQQELSLAPHLSVVENVALGAVPTRRGLIDYGRLAVEVGRVLDRLGLDVALDQPVEELPLGKRQLVEIAKALYRQPRVLILDEPTSSLTAHEVQALFKVLAELKREGVALVYISHRMNEVMHLCDWVTVLKDGTRTADRTMEGVDPPALVRLMVGREPGDLFPPFRSTVRDELALETRALTAPGVQGVDLAVRQGEVLGIGGLLGQGQEELLLALYGALEAQAERLTTGGIDRPSRNPADAIGRGLAYVPADRKREAVLLPLSIRFNLTLPGMRRLARRGLRRFAREAEVARELTAKLNVRGGGPERAVQLLSGGNQQKVALARWLPLSPKVLLLNDPTRGVDVDTKREIYLRLKAMAADGMAVILLSSDALELVHLCDRVLVFRDGRIAADLPHGQASEEAIVGASLGVARQEAA